VVKHIVTKTQEVTLKAHISSSTIAAIRSPAILDTLPYGAYITDIDRRIVFWSKSAQRIMGWTAAEVTGRNGSDNILVHVDKDARLMACPRRHVKNGDARSPNV